MRICHLTSAHSRYDVRIYLKQCKSLSANGFDVNLVVADGRGDESVNDIKIYDAGVNQGRIKRMLITTRNVYKKALLVDAQIYHLHDPELIPVGLKLLKKGKKVVFDAHEDLIKQILTKPYLKPWQGKILSFILKRYESYALGRFTAICCATQTITDKFLKINQNSSTINNYPILGELGDLDEDIGWEEKDNSVCYVGGISRIRGVAELVQSLSLLNSGSVLELAGKFSRSDFLETVRELDGWERVNELGLVERQQVKEIMKRSRAGIVTFLPAPNHIESQPNKMFEYMSAGLPVVSSNFDMWKEIIEGNDCGVCVDPTSPASIAAGIDEIMQNPVRAKAMGENGKRAVLGRYNWHVEEKKLTKIYNNLH